MPRKTPIPVATVLGFRIHERRGIAGTTQDDVARAAVRLGFPWSRSTVAAIEAGIRQVTTDELLALPYIFDEAIRVANPDDEMANPVTLADLLKPGPSQSLALSDHLALDQVTVKNWLGEAAPVARPRRLNEAPSGEAEVKAARRLGVDVDTVVAVSNRLWGRSLTEERDARVDSSGSARSRQASRGHVTRQLLKELTETLADKEGRP